MTLLLFYSKRSSSLDWPRKIEESNLHCGTTYLVFVLPSNSIPVRTVITLDETAINASPMNAGKRSTSIPTDIATTKRIRPVIPDPARIFMSITEPYRSAIAPRMGEVRNMSCPVI
jgi:hypothetical protein